MSRFKVRKEMNGSVVYDRLTRNSAFTDRDLFQSSLTNLAIEEAVCGILGVKRGDERIDIDFIDNGLSGRGTLSAPVAAYMEISNFCNLKCRHCYKGAISTDDVLTSDEVHRTIDELAEMGVFELRLTGYEPVISPNFRSVAEYAVTKDFYLVVNTNAYYGPKYAKALFDIPFDEVIVSIDGCQEAHNYIRGRGSFERAVALLKRLQVSGRRTRINTVVSKRNLHDIATIGQLAHATGAYVNFLPLRTGGQSSSLKATQRLTAQDMYTIVQEVGALRESYPATRFLTYFDILGCESDTYHPMWMCDPCPARKNIYISGNGDTYPCDFLSYLGEAFKGGNVRNVPISEMWHGSTGLQRYWMLSRTSKCTSCPLLNKRCYGGCASETLANRQIYDDPLCFRGMLVRQPVRPVIRR